MQIFEHLSGNKQGVCNKTLHFILSFDRFEFEHSVKKGVWQGSQKKIDGGP